MFSALPLILLPLPSHALAFLGQKLIYVQDRFRATPAPASTLPRPPAQELYPPAQRTTIPHRPRPRLSRRPPRMRRTTRVPESWSSMDLQRLLWLSVTLFWRRCTKFSAEMYCSCEESEGLGGRGDQFDVFCGRFPSGISKPNGMSLCHTE